MWSRANTFDESSLGLSSKIVKTIIE